MILKLESNEYICGYTLEINGKYVQIQFEKQRNRLHADYDNFYAIIDRENEYNLSLTESEEQEVLEFIKKLKVPKF